MNYAENYIRRFINKKDPKDMTADELLKLIAEIVDKALADYDEAKK